MLSGYRRPILNPIQPDSRKPTAKDKKTVKFMMIEHETHPRERSENSTETELPIKMFPNYFPPVSTGKISYKPPKTLNSRLTRDLRLETSNYFHSQP
jgi:hypothetical protein